MELLCKFNFHSLSKFSYRISFSWFKFYTKSKNFHFNQVKDTAVQAHADEFETSLYLHLAKDRVQMDKAGKDDDVMGTYLSSDSTGVGYFNDYWGRWTELGVHGDATTATAEKGEIIFEAAVSGLITLVEEWKTWPIAERKDQHRHPVQKQIRW